MGKLYLAIALFGIIIFLVDCTDSVETFVKENISEYPCVVKSKGWKRWEVYFKDKPDYKFEVLLWRLSGRKWESNFNKMFSYYYYNEYIKNYDCILVVGTSSDDRTFSGYDIDYNIYGYYSTEEEIDLLVEDISKYFDYVQKQKYPFVEELSNGGGFMTGSAGYYYSVKISCIYVPDSKYSYYTTIKYLDYMKCAEEESIEDWKERWKNELIFWKTKSDSEKK